MLEQRLLTSYILRRLTSYILRLTSYLGSVFFGFSRRALQLRRAAAVIASVPAERLLLESDEHSAEAASRALGVACSRLAGVRGWSDEEAAQRTAANAMAAFEPAGWL